jgi:hypothetical protein
MNNGNRMFFPAVALVALSLAAGASAEPPEATPGKGPDKPAKAEEKAAAKATRADEKAARVEAKSEKAEAKPGVDRDKEKVDGDPSKYGRGPGHAGHDHPRGGFRALGEDFRQGRVKKAELKERLAALRSSASERRREHQKAMGQRFGAALSNPSCREQLRVHARREAFLNRALFVAETEVTKDKEKLVARIEKLSEKEDERFARAMERCKTMPAGMTSVAPPAASDAPPAAAPPPTPAAPSASAAKAGEP